MFKTVITLFLLGLSFGSGPCIASCGPILISYIAGTKKRILKSILGYILFSLSRICAYVLLGLLVFSVGRLTSQQLLGNFSKYIVILGGGFIITVGVLMMLGKRIESTLWHKLELSILERDKKSLAIFGLIIGFSPCAPLLAVFSYLGLVSRTWWHNLLYSLSFGLGTLLSPLILLAGLAGLIPRLLQGKKELYYKIFSFICGLIIIFLGLQLIKRVF